MHALRRARQSVPNPNPRGFGAKLGLVLFGIDAVDTLGLLRGAFGPLVDRCVLKIDKTATYLVSELDL